jgi:hypothetical protein
MELLDEMLDRILAKTEEVWARNGVGMLAIAYLVG